MRDVNIEKLTKRAIAIYSHERIALIDGDIEALRDAASKKAALLADLNAIEAQIKSQPSGVMAEQIRGQMTSLHSIIARRTSENTQLARANSTNPPTAWQ